jgi:hypothetical protein
MIQKLIIVLGIVATITGCDNRKDYVYDSLVKPDIGFSKTKSEEGVSFISDSVKLNFNTYTVFYTSNELKVVKPTIEIDYDQNGLEIVKNDNLKSLTIKALSPGAYPVNIILKDLYGNTSSAKLYLTIFDNLPPVAVMEYSITSDGRVEFDLSKSYDRDKRFGGKITEFKFKPKPNYEFNSFSPKAPIQFPGKGTFPVTFSVKDNNNVWSDPLNTFITL